MPNINELGQEMLEAIERLREYDEMLKGREALKQNLIERMRHEGRINVGLWLAREKLFSPLYQYSQSEAENVIKWFVEQAANLELGPYTDAEVETMLVAELRRTFERQKAQRREQAQTEAVIKQARKQGFVWSIVFAIFVSSIVLLIYWLYWS